MAMQTSWIGLKLNLLLNPFLAAMSSLREIDIEWNLTGFQKFLLVLGPTPELYFILAEVWLGRAEKVVGLQLFHASRKLLPIISHIVKTLFGRE